MHKEMDPFHHNHTWTLVPCPDNYHVVGWKWLFCTKYYVDGSIERLKTSLVPYGVSQIPGLDFSQTFSLVVKASIVHTVLSLAVINNWKLHQHDVNNTFHHCDLSECVYMEKPPRFQYPYFPNHVCFLNKALYGIK